MNKSFKAALRFLDRVRAIPTQGTIRVDGGGFKVVSDSLLECCQRVIETVDAVSTNYGVASPSFNFPDGKPALCLSFSKSKSNDCAFVAIVFGSVIKVYSRWLDYLADSSPDGIFTTSEAGLTEFGNYVKIKAIKLNLRLKSTLRKLDGYRSWSSTLTDYSYNTVVVSPIHVSEDLLKRAGTVVSFVVNHLKHISVNCTFVNPSLCGNVVLAFAIKNTFDTIYYLNVQGDKVSFYDSKFQYSTYNKLDEHLFPVTAKGLKSLRFHILERLKLIHAMTLKLKD